MQLIKRCEKIGNILFYISILMHTTVMCMGNSVWEVPYRGRLLQVAFVLCCIKIFTTHYLKVQWGLFFLVATLGCISYFFSHEKYILYLLVLIYAARSTDINTVIKTVLYSVIVTSAVIIALSLSGVAGDISVIKDYGRGMVENRFTLGFSHTNNLHGTIWYIISLLMMSYKKKLDYKFYAIAALLNIFVYVLTASRTGVAVVFLMILAGVLYRYFDKFFFARSWTYILGYILLLGVVILTLVSVSVDYQTGYGPVLTKLNKYTTGRISLAYQGAYIGDWKLFTACGNKAVTVDNGFAAIPASYGVVTLLICVGVIAYLISRCQRSRDGIIYAVMITTILYTFMERSYVINDAYLLSNPIVLVAMGYMDRRKED